MTPDPVTADPVTAGSVAAAGEATGEAAAGTVVMPDFVRPRRGARHTIDTALRALRALGLDDARVTVESAGVGWAPHAVVRQQPPPGAPVGPHTRVTLSVCGVGALEALPYALRDLDDSAFGVDPLMALLDNPVHKLRHHLRGGGEFFALRPDDPVSARRWIEEVFQIDPSPWHRARWPAIARLLPVLHRTAGHEAGVTLALRLVFGLPLAAFGLERAFLPAPYVERLTLGTRGARLGVDALLGVGRTEVARLALTVGPVSLATYRAHEAPELLAERRAVYALVVPASLASGVVERWIVGDPHAAARLAGGALGTLGAYAARAEFAPLDGAGDGGAPAVLGLTTRLGPLGDTRG